MPSSRQALARADLLARLRARLGSLPRAGRKRGAGTGLVRGLGFEPRLTESESVVLPLNYPRAFAANRGLVTYPSLAIKQPCRLVPGNCVFPPAFPAPPKLVQSKAKKGLKACPPASRPPPLLNGFCGWDAFGGSGKGELRGRAEQVDARRWRGGRSALKGGLPDKQEG